MAFTKITNSELNSRGATTLPNQPTISAAALKQEFDAPAKEIVAPHFNGLIDELEADTAGASIGLQAPSRRTGSTVKAVVDAISQDLVTVEGKLNGVTNAGLLDAIYLKHGHENKALLDTYDQTNEDIKDAVNRKHSHSNKSVLDKWSESAGGTPLYNGQAMSGDMYSSEYDPDSTVKNAGGIELYVTNGLGTKVDKVDGKGLSTNDFTDTLKTKLDNIESGAEVNVQADYAQNDTTADDYIKNKPTLGTASSKNSTSVVTDSTDLVESGAVKDIVGWGNKNLLEGFELGNINHTTGAEEASTTIARTMNYIPVTAGEEYTISGSITVNLRVFTFNASKTYINSDDTISISSGTGHYTIPSGVSFIRLIGTASGIGSDMQFEKGSTATSYEPYHASVEETLRDAEVIKNKNLVDYILYGCNIDLAGGIAYDGSFTIAVAKVKSGVTYVITTNDANKVYGFFTSKPVPGSRSYNNQRVVTNVVYFTSPIDGYVAFRTVLDYETPQLEVGSTATAYEPYYTPLKDVVPNKCDNSVIAPVENEATASQAYAVGQHFIKDGQFKEVTQPIASGGAINSSNTTDKPIADCLVYKAGDSIVISDDTTYQIPVEGYLTSAGKAIFMFIRFDKPLSGVTNILFSSESKIYVRGASGYILNGTLLNTLMLSATKIVPTGILVVFGKTDGTAFNETDSNKAVNIALLNCTVTLS